MLFTELSLKSSSLQAIEAMGFQSPTDIQEQSIPLLIDRDVDFVGQAQTGTGKTLFEIASLVTTSYQFQLISL